MTELLKFACVFDDGGSNLEIPQRIGVFGLLWGVVFWVWLVEMVEDGVGQAGVISLMYGSMSYTVLARRYRSNTFDEVVGQEPIARTLLNAIGTGRVAHAYLFTGTRGVGKTTTARLFARALNAPATIPGCPTLGEDAADKPKKKSKKAADETFEYPDADVQDRMASAVMRGEDLNVIEIDGASNRGVDEARQLIANAGLAPTGNARFKIYIIDEVHMLTREAFNALLKTMEEPPAHVKFILCTTESHKLPATIQSRCQRFDFRNISTAAIDGHLTDVLAKEKIKADKEVVFQVARLGNGSMRDALSLLDRLIATGEDPLTSQVLEQMLGLPPEELMIGLIDAMADGDVSAALTRTGELLGRGIAEEQMVEVLIERLRQLMLVSACGPDSELVELSDDSKKQAVVQAGRFDAAGLVHMITLSENLHRSARASSNPRALLDATIVRLTLAEKMADISALLSSGRASAAGLGTKKKVIPSSGGPGAADSNARTPVRVPEQAQNQNQSQNQSQSQGHASEVARANPASQSSGSTNEKREPISSDNPQAVWNAVLDVVGQRNSLAWVRNLQLQSIEGGAAVVTNAPGKKNVGDFVQDRQRQQLADLLRPIIGKPVRVQVQQAGGQRTDAPSPQAANANTHSNANTSRQMERRAAMELPLVKQVMDEFGASVIATKKVEKSSDS